MSSRMWRVIDEAGTVHEATVEAVQRRCACAWRAHTDTASGLDATERGAVVALALAEGWPLAEVLAPGERSRAELAADNATLRAELDDLRGRLSRTAARLADVERTGAALDFNATLAALRQVPARQWCGCCGEERTRWCVRCGWCETTCCACPGGLDANGSEVPCG